MASERAIQRPQERPALALVVLPGVLAVEDDRNDGFPAAGPRRIPPAAFDQPADEVLGRGLRVPPGVGEPDQIREHVVAEHAGDSAPPVRTT